MKPLKLLIIEDLMDDALLLQHHLSNAGYDVQSTIVQTSADLKSELANGDWDIILSDYEMPGFSGLEALQVLKDTGLDIPFIIISGVIGEDTAVGAMKVGVHDYLMKSNLKRLVPAIEREIQNAASRRKKRMVEEALRRSEASLVNAQRIAHIGNWKWDIQNDQISGSEETYKIFGLVNPQFEYFYETFFTSIHPEDRQLVKTATEAALSGAAPFNIEHRIIRPDGEERIIWEIGEVLFDESNKPLLLTGTVQDITERIKAQETLSTSEAKFRDLFDNAPIAYHELDKEGCFTRINHTEELMLGYTEAELIGRHPAEIIVEKESREATTAKLAKQLPLHPVERTFIKKDGTLVSVLNEDRLIYDKEGIVTGIRSTLQNITERKSIEQALETAAHRERAMIENSLDVICTIDAEGKFVTISPASLKVWGYQPEELVGQPFIKFVVPEDVEKTNKVLLKIKSGIDTRDFENHFLHKDGSRVDISWTAFWSKSDHLMFCVAHNVTKTKELEEKLRQAQKLESVGLLAGGIAHDFNNMLTVINGYSDLTLRKLKQGDPLRRNIEEIKKAGLRSADFTHQLLAFSRQQLLQPVIIDINDIITDTIKMLQRLIGEDIQLTTSLFPKIGQVMFDPGQFSQIIMNLAVNARDSMPQGGMLTIKTDNIFLDEDYSGQIIGILPGAYVLFIITDTGSGMSDEVKQHMFDPFYTTKKIGQGTGLGLATVYGIVKQSGGNIEVETAEGFGTTFKVYLPRVVGQIEAKDKNKDSIKMVEGSETILLVEDEEIVRNLSREVLETCGYRVIEAENGVEALALYTPDFKIDLLMTDVVMPQMGGRELAEKLMAKLPNLQILFTSGYTDDEIVRHGGIGTNTNFLQKPYTPESLAKNVRNILDNYQKS